MLSSQFTSSLVLLAMIPTSFAQNQNFSLPAVCTATNLEEIIFSTKEEKGHLCGFPSTTHLNFSSRCGEGEEVVYKDPCM